MHRFRVWFVTGLMALGLIATTGTMVSAAAGERPRSYRERRYEGVVGQTDWSSCGPAVLATYFTSFVGRTVSEAEMIALTARRAGTEGLFAGTSMLQLKDALIELGVPAFGYRVDVDELVAYFERGGPPLILHVTRPRLHYVLAVGVVRWAGRAQLLMADPSYGRRAIAPAELAEQFGFSGVVLVPVPSEPLMNEVKGRQAAWIEREHRHLRRLEVAGR